MTRFLTIIGLVLVLALAAACSPSVRVQNDWDEGADFDRYVKFSIMESSGVQDQLVARRITNAVRIHLTERNFVEDNENPDFLVASHVNVVDRVDVQSWGYSASSRNWHGGRDITVTNYQEGTMIIDFVRADANELFWRGWGTRSVTSSAREQQAIQEVVDRILSQYPPE